MEYLLFEAARTSVAVAPPLPMFTYSEGGSEYVNPFGQLKFIAWMPEACFAENKFHRSGCLAAPKVKFGDSILIYLRKSSLTS